MTTCSDLHRERGDSLLGTAPRMEALVLVECRRPWDSRIEKSTDFPAGLKDLVKRAEDRSGSEIQILGTPGSRGPDDPREVRVYRRLPGGGIRLGRLAWDGGEAGREALLEALVLGPAEPAPPTILVCTHGSRDRCCGTLGYPLAEALRAHAGDGVEVLECSHLGGHRYAPTLLALGQWRCYGDLRPEEAPLLLRHLQEGRVLAGRHRGACWLEKPGQVAEGAPWEALPEPLESVRLLALEKRGDACQAAVEVRRPDGTTSRFRVLFAEHEFHALASCQDLPEGRTKKSVEFRILEFAPQD